MFLQNSGLGKNYPSRGKGVPTAMGLLPKQISVAVFIGFLLERPVQARSAYSSESFSTYLGASFALGCMGPLTCVSGISKPVVWVTHGLPPWIPVVFVIFVVSVIPANPALNSLFVAV